MAALPPNSIIDISLTSSLDRTDALQIAFLGNPIDDLEFTLGLDQPNARISIKSFTGHTLTASQATGTATVAWTTDAAGGVSQTFTNSTSFVLTVSATKSPTAPAKKKDIKITIKPVGSDGRNDYDDGQQSHGRGRGRGRNFDGGSAPTR